MRKPTKKKRAALAARPLTKCSLIDATKNSEKHPSPQAEIWPAWARDAFKRIAITASPSIVPGDDPNERLPMRIARRERDRLARLRLKVNTPEPQQRPDKAAAIAAAEFGAAKRRGRRR